ncbi:MAG TPA: hypothetical protein VF666_12315 [Pyrinomonadaceae bacterium]|jgi:hypothetical protein
MRSRKFAVLSIAAITTVFFLLLSGVGASFFSAYTHSAVHVTEVQVFASYQFNTLKNPTSLLWLEVQQHNAPSKYVLYIADSRNHVIRSFKPDLGQLSVVAGTLDTSGYVNGSATSAKFNYPVGLSGERRVWGGQTGCNQWWNATCISPQISVYTTHVLHINDSQNYVVRKLCTGTQHQNSGDCTGQMGMVSTIGGSHTKGYTNGTASSASFSALAGHSDIGGACYINDAENHCIRAEDSSGNVTTYAGTAYAGYVNGYRTAARFNVPTKVISDSSGNMIVADVGNNAIRKIDTSGYVTTVGGQGPTAPGYVNGPGYAAKFFRPTSIVQSGSDTYVADSFNNCIRKIDSSGNVSTYAGSTEAGLVNGSLSQARFNMPTDLVILNGFMYIADSANNAIRVINMSTGTVSNYIT